MPWIHCSISSNSIELLLVSCKEVIFFHEKVFEISLPSQCRGVIKMETCFYKSLIKAVQHQMISTNWCWSYQLCFSRSVIFHVFQTQQNIAPYWLSHSYCTGITEAGLRWCPSNINTNRTLQRNRKLTYGAIVNPAPEPMHYRNTWVTSSLRRWKLAQILPEV